MNIKVIILFVLFVCFAMPAKTQESQEKSTKKSIIYKVNGEETKVSKGEIKLPAGKAMKQLSEYQEGRLPLYFITNKKGVQSLSSLKKKAKSKSYFSFEGKNKTVGIQNLTFRKFTKEQIDEAQTFVDQFQVVFSWFSRKSTSQKQFWNYGMDANWHSGSDFAIDEIEEVRSTLEVEKFKEDLNHIIAAANLERDSTINFLSVEEGDHYYLEAEVTNVTSYHVGRGAFVTEYAMAHKVSVIWEVKNQYGESLASIETDAQSGFLMNYMIKSEDDQNLAFAQAMQFSLLELLQHPEMEKLLSAPTESELEEKQELLYFSKPTKAATSISEVVDAGVSIVKGDQLLGSGFALNENGLILTSYSIFSDEDIDEIEILFSDGSRHQMSVVRINRSNNLALLNCSGKTSVSVKLNSDPDIVEIGNTVYALGTPVGADLGQSVSKGIISGQRKTGATSKLIQTDAKISRGYGGGPIVTKEGLALGMITFKIGGIGIEGVAFGVQMHNILEILKVEFK